MPTHAPVHSSHPMIRKRTPFLLPLPLLLPLLLLIHPQDSERCKDPVEYVQALLDERDKYEAIVAQSFGEDKLFRNALSQVCG